MSNDQYLTINEAIEEAVPINEAVEEAVREAIAAEQERVVRATLDYPVGPLDAKENFFRLAKLEHAYEAVIDAEVERQVTQPVAPELGTVYTVSVWRPHGTPDLADVIAGSDYDAVVTSRGRDVTKQDWERIYR